MGMKECTPAFFKMTRVVQEIGDKISVVNGHGEFLEPYAAMAGTAGFIFRMLNIVPDKAAALLAGRSHGGFGRAKAIPGTMGPFMDLGGKNFRLGGGNKVILLV